MTERESQVDLSLSRDREAIEPTDVNWRLDEISNYASPKCDDAVGSSSPICLGELC